MRKVGLLKYLRLRALRGMNAWKREAELFGEGCRSSESKLHTLSSEKSLDSVRTTTTIKYYSLAKVTALMGK